MKLTVKTLQGVPFSIEAEPTNTVAEVKGKIEAQQSFPVAQQKLIHAGKVLKDDSPLSEYNIKENDFLVVMVTKPKAPRAAPAAPAPAPAAAATATSAAPGTTSAATATTAPSTSSASSSSTATAAAVSTPSAAPATTAAPSSSGSASAASGGAAGGEEVSAAVQQLCDMGFPEDQVRAALQAAFNNPERAVEYLMNGIPEHARAGAAAPSTQAPASGAADSGLTLEALRNHPQFDALRQLIQSNPAALPAVLQQIGGQNPELLRMIHQNQDQFVRMLNEPITSSSTAGAGAAPGAAGAPADLGAAFGGAGAGGVPTPQQVQQIFDSLSPEQQAQMAAQLGVTPEQLRGVSQMLSSMPPGAVEQMMAGMGGMGGMGGAGGAPDGAHRIMLTEEDAAAVDRLCDMGFERSEVIQAYLACEKNEALAANFLMDSMSEAFGGGAGDDNDDIYG
ncbi:TPA: hypothetical protein N0F65_006461 [Lagenidium giganteum]|uniref:UV excision repair protein RAD23 n=1 Tax=Lagenidium giganteum TaxID=4803 RepID=A0AAV2Z479_9STRA|nr:TPA: hypothetical protein N0F65_006461 [Lagenidium giganteum]